MSFYLCLFHLIQNDIFFSHTELLLRHHPLYIYSTLKFLKSIQQLVLNRDRGRVIVWRYDGSGMESYV